MHAILDQMMATIANGAQSLGILGEVVAQGGAQWRASVKAAGGLKAVIKAANRPWELFFKDGTWWVRRTNRGHVQ